MRRMVWCALVAIGCDRFLKLDEVEVGHDAPPDTTSDAVPYEDCPIDYIAVPGTNPNSRYKFVATTLAWPYAEAECETHTQTKITHLAVFEDTFEPQYLGSSAVVGFDMVHVGYARVPCSDWMTFYAVTGATLPYGDPRWNPNEPNGSGTCDSTATGEETVTWFGQGGRLVTDGPWYAMLAYLCECDHVPVARTFPHDP